MSAATAHHLWIQRPDLDLDYLDFASFPCRRQHLAQKLMLLLEGVTEKVGAWMIREDRDCMIKR